MGLTAYLLIALKGSVALLIFAVGLDSRLRDLSYLTRRPGVMLRSLLAMYLVVPLLALSAVKLLQLPAGLELALVVLAISAGAPMLPRKLMRLGNEEYVISLVIVSSLLAIVTVPAWLLLLGSRFDRLEALDPATVAGVLGKSFLLPMLLGIAVRWIMPDASARLSDVLLKFVGIVFSACALLLLATHWQVVGAILGPTDPGARRIHACGARRRAPDGRSGPERSHRARSHLRDTTRRRGHGDRGRHAGASHRRADRGLHDGFSARDHSVHEVARTGAPAGPQRSN